MSARSRPISDDLSAAAAIGRGQLSASDIGLHLTEPPYRLHQSVDQSTKQQAVDLKQSPSCGRWTNFPHRQHSRVD